MSRSRRFRHIHTKRDQAIKLPPIFPPVNNYIKFPIIFFIARIAACFFIIKIQEPHFKLKIFLKNPLKKYKLLSYIWKYYPLMYPSIPGKARLFEFEACKVNCIKEQTYIILCVISFFLASRPSLANIFSFFLTIRFSLIVEYDIFVV